MWSGARAVQGDFDVRSPEIVTTQSMLGSGPGDLSSSAVSRIVDAYERLGTRLLSRMRDLREDVDADLSELRSEISSLRTSIEDVADRVQLRQMRSSIDDLRSDVAGLRRAVLEWPELERVATDVSALRAATTELQQAVSAGPAAMSATPGKGAVSVPAEQSQVAGEVLRMFSAINVGMARLSDSAQLSAGSGPSGLGGIEERLTPAIDEISARLTDLQRAVESPPADGVVHAQLAQLQAAMADRDQSDPLEVVSGELAELRIEMVALRRRIALKASSTGAALGEADLEAIASVVAERLVEVIRPQ